VAGLLLLGLTAQAEFNEPFDRLTVAAPEGQLSANWRTLQSTMQSEQVIIARCRAKPQSCTSPAALQFISIVKEGAEHHGLAQIGRINRAVNSAIRPANSGVITTWTSPLAALATGIGDCKQYAVLKYAALGDAGIAPDDLRVIIVTTRSQPGTHAVVAVRHAARWYILDSRTLAVVESRQLIDYQPRFALDYRGVRQFIVPGSPHVAGLFSSETIAQDASDAVGQPCSV
jgi:predicted transglutaminase-like cysteine proteinase